jgi:uncharacterized protein
MMDWWLILLAGAGLTLAGVIKGATGLGYSSCALPFLVTALGLKPAMALVIIPAFATNVSVALSAGHVIETLSRFKVLYAATLPGILLGIGLLLWVDQTTATKVLGIGIISYATLSLTKPNLSLPARLEKPLQFPTGFVNGVMTGLTGAQVMPLFPYMMSLNLEPSRMVQAINLSVMIASSLLALGLLATGIMTLPLLGASVLAIFPALLGVEIGARARHLITAQQFKRIVLMTLFLIGTLMIWR